MIRFLPALLLMAAVSRGEEPTVLWPVPPPATGVSRAEFPVYREYSYFKDFQDHVDKARSAPVDLIFDGDENTCYWTGPGQKTWSRFSSRNTIDFAPEHDRVENLLWRLNHGELDGLHPKLIVLQIGANNLGNPPEEIAAGIKLAVESCRTRCPDAHVLLLGLFPRGPAPTDHLRMLTQQVNDLIAKLDDGKNVTFLNLDGKFLQPDGALKAELFRNETILSDAGYETWADAIEPIVDQYCPKSATAAASSSAPSVLSKEPTFSWPYPVNPPPGVSSSTYPVPPVGWLTRFSQNLDQLKQGPYDLIFDGDSITDNWRGPGKDVWKERYGNRAVNMGIGGDEVENVLWRTQHGELAGQHPKLIELLVGTNNHGQDPKEVAAGIKLILHEYETRCPEAHILLLGIFPNSQAMQTPQRAWIAQVNAIISTSSDDKVTYLDIGPKFLQPDGTLTAEIMPDFLHPSAKGYAIWADAIQPVIDRYLPEPAAK